MKKRFLGLMLLVICVFLVGCNKKAETSEDIKININSNINEELKDVFEFAILNETSLVAILRDGKQVVIFDPNKTPIKNGEKTIKNGHYSFEYYFDNDDAAIYVYLVYSMDKHYIGKISLANGNGNYALEILTSVKSNTSFTSSITKVKDTIYFANSEVIAYNTKDNKTTKIGVASKNRYMALLSYDNLLFYQTSNGVYSYNIDTKETKRITDEGSTAYIYNGQLIYYYIGGSNGEYDENKDLSYYVYDPVSEKSVRISKLFGAQSLGEEFVIPFGSKYYSIQGLTLYVFDGKDISKYHELSCDDFKDIISKCTSYDIGYINSITRISNNELLLLMGDDALGEPEPFLVKFNLDTKKVTKVNDDIRYKFVQYVY